VGGGKCCKSCLAHSSLRGEASGARVALANQSVMRFALCCAALVGYATAWRMAASEQQLRALAYKLEPAYDLSAANSAVADALISTLDQLPLPDGMKVSRSRKAGSQGKGISLSNSDIDFVRFVSSDSRPDLLPPGGNLALRPTQCSN
jgi:hypothetical protein